MEAATIATGLLLFALGLILGRVTSSNRICVTCGWPKSQMICQACVQRQIAWLERDRDGLRERLSYVLEVAQTFVDYDFGQSTGKPGQVN